VSPTVKHVLWSLPLLVSLLWLLVDAPGPFLREAWFVVLLTTLTIGTRTLTWRAALFGVSLGIGLAAPAMVAVGWAMARAGLDVSESEVGSWLVVPVLEEVIKLAPVGLMAWLHSRRARLTFNPSDWLLAGCAVGAGFAMVENAELVRNNPGVLRDMAEQYGPSWLVPGAWGAAGFVGHAAATGMAAGGIGLWFALRRMATGGRILAWMPTAALCAPIAWITLEHVLANLYVNTSADAALLLGNGRLTPWLFLALASGIIVLDAGRFSRVLRHSRTLRTRQAMIREALLGSKASTRVALQQRFVIAATELRVINTTAWLTLERLLQEKK
jgi:RsiW-degrading membrane proteinase PrsW (M82 family)